MDDSGVNYSQLSQERSPEINQKSAYEIEVEIREGEEVLEELGLKMEGGDDVMWWKGVTAVFLFVALVFLVGLIYYFIHLV